jgi:hypothetical protein
VLVEAYVVKKKGDMILLNKPTASNGAMLVTAGQAYLRLKKDNQEVTLAPNAKISLRFPSFPVNSAMQLFFGQDVANGEFNWVTNIDTLNNTLAFGQQQYDIVTNRLRWINLDYFYDTVGLSRTTIQLKLPPNYTNVNTTCFLAFKEVNAVLRMQSNVAARLFTTGKIPDGKNAWLVTMSRQGNDYFFNTQAIVTGQSATGGVQSVTATPIKTSLPDIKAWLATL